MAREISLVCNFIFGSVCANLPTDTVDIELTIRTVKGIYTYRKDHVAESMVFSPWSRSVIPFPLLRRKIKAFQDENRQILMWASSKVMPWFSIPPKPHCNARKCTSGKVSTRWSNRNHRFNPIKMNRCNTLDTQPNNLNKIDIVQPIPKRSCKCPLSGST